MKIEIKVPIMGDEWTVELLDESAFDKKMDDAEGYTVAADRKITLNNFYLSKKLVIHELTHAYKSYQYTDAAHLEFDQLEEIYCELFAHRGKEILQKANKIYKFFEKHGEKE
jgi:hypothetical protein